MRFITLLVISYLFLWLITKITFWLNQRPTTKQAKSTTPDKGNLMVPCNKCRVYILENQAIRRQERYYCCKEHVQ